MHSNLMLGYLFNDGLSDWHDDEEFSDFAIKESVGAVCLDRLWEAKLQLVEVGDFQGEDVIQHFHGDGVTTHKHWQ